jgi:hypothetical protein
MRTWLRAFLFLLGFLSVISSHATAQSLWIYSDHWSVDTEGQYQIIGFGSASEDGGGEVLVNPSLFGPGYALLGGGSGIRSRLRDGDDVGTIQL